jgi:putative endonuclease
MAFFTYIMASRPYGTLYTGSTDGLISRVVEHKEKVRPAAFTAKYDVHRLVWYELHHSRDDAFRRERRIKQWNRAWKIRIIEEINPYWDDLYEDIIATPEGPMIISHLSARPKLSRL